MAGEAIWFAMWKARDLSSDEWLNIAACIKLRDREVKYEILHKI
jgi:hypothetical protein